ncbi:MAG: hypothetical protein ABL876_19090 [Chitinophagaceae bacterium]
MSVNDIYIILVILHLVGAVLGVGAATFIEVFLNKSLADGKMDDVEKGFMKTTYIVLRVGLVLSVLTGIGFLMYYYSLGQYAKLTSEVLWAKNTIILVLVVNAVLLHLHKMKLRWGSSLSFMSWWVSFVLGIFLTNNQKYGYFEIIGFYILMVVIGAFILEWVRGVTKNKIPPAQPPQTT